jgi:isoleucyl-tRNA synthetase
MPFDKVETQVDFPALEREVLRFWESHAIFETLRARNRGGPRWSFLDGPITANNPMGVHHAWGRTYKDAFQRYHAMLGQHLRYQNGFDCQGLWVEVEVEKELDLQSKRDIEDLVAGDPFASIDHFVQLCKQRVDKFARVQTEQSVRLGYWMDWDRTDEDWARPPDQRKSYFTLSEENNYTIWSFLKKCHSRGLVYRGYDAMPWCPRCAVGLSEMETKEGYRTAVHKAVFVKFPLRGRPGESLLVWTTTPWTLTSNVGAAVNPDLTYLRVRHRGEVYYLAKGAFTASRSETDAKEEEEGEPGKPKGKQAWPAGVPRLKTIEQLFREKSKDGYEVEGELKGADMVSWAYDGPFDEFPAQAHPGGYPEPLAEVVRRQKWAADGSARDAHRVVAWKDVGETEGTGIVHIAPGCGREDFELGKEQGLPPVAPLDESGLYLPGFGALSGQSAGDNATAEAVLASLQEKGLLFATERYPHRYPHCWRCKTELLYRLVDEWFTSMSWREEIMRICEDIRWIPEDGKKRELDWLRNMGDWMISKKRFWGLALPIWVDEQTGEFEVIGSREELKERAVEGWEQFEGHSPHRPWVDLVKIRNPRTGNLMSRIPDVGNPWLDAGIVPYSTMGYNKDREEWKKWFPADFITESFPGQFRNWFYALLAMSAMMEGKAPFKVLLGHATVHDQFGDPMHKAAGNSIPFEGAADTGYTLTRILEPKDNPKALAAGSRSFEVEVEDGKKVLVAQYPPMSADLIRWMFCRHNPVTNINFGPIPAEELRARFTLKLWNTYAFFSTYARLDNFDPNGPEVPVGERPDIDRWILSDLQKLIRVARRAFETYDVMTLCLEAEKFIDDKVSNWYVRRNRRRFWKGEQGADKQAAYQTLYAVLVTLARLFAPIMPFLSEHMYQNLVVRGAGAGPQSVHLCEYPAADEALVDEALSNEMEALLRLVSLGSAARNAARIGKVRQPLAELRVQPGGVLDRRAVERFAGQIEEELNVQEVTLHDPAEGPLLTQEVGPNMKTLGKTFGARLSEVLSALAAAPAAEVAARVQAGQTIELACAGGLFTLEPDDVVVQWKAPEGWAGVADRGTQVMIDARLTEELRREGMARDVVRQVQELRKQSNLEVEDRIALWLDTDSERLRQAIDAHRGYIATETLAAQWATQPLNGEGHCTHVKVEGQDLFIELRRLAGA